jgi:hypothetical protein
MCKGRDPLVVPGLPSGRPENYAKKPPLQAGQAVLRTVFEKQKLSIKSKVNESYKG